MHAGTQRIQPLYITKSHAPTPTNTAINTSHALPTMTQATHTNRMHQPQGKIHYYMHCNEEILHVTALSNVRG